MEHSDHISAKRHGYASPVVREIETSNIKLIEFTQLQLWTISVLPVVDTEQMLNLNQIKQAISWFKSGQVCYGNLCFKFQQYLNMTIMLFLPAVPQAAPELLKLVIADANLL